MTTSWFCSDLHIGHKNIEKFRHPLISSTEHNTSRIFDDWKHLVGKRDDVYVLGDVCFDIDLLKEFENLSGSRKFLVRGNHDEFDTQVYLKYFDAVYGLKKYKEFWLSHAPMHPDELRGKVNLHGHVHFTSVRKPFNPVYDTKQELDSRYFNCCPENLWPTFGTSLVSLDTIRNYLANCNG